MDDIFVYCVKMPQGIHETVVPCLNGYTIYIDRNLDYEHQLAAYNHALRHIQNNDFEKTDVQEIETEAHKSRTRGEL